MSSKTTPEFFPLSQAGDIQMRRNRLLEDVNSASGMLQIGQNDSKALNQERDEHPNRQEDPHNTYTMDPLHFLPAELWIDIVREATIRAGTTMSTIDALLLLTLVSSDWRTKLISAPRLWTDVTVGTGEADAQAKLETALWLSKDLHFTLRVMVPSLQWVENLPLFQMRAHRIKQIDFILAYGRGREPPDDYVVNEFIYDVFSSIGHFPTLQVMQVYIRPQLLLNWQDIATRAPNLRYVYSSTGVPLEVVRNLSLRVCTIDAQSDEVLQSLGDINHVEGLSWILAEDVKTYSKVCLPPSMPALRSIESFDILNSNFLLLLKLTGNLNTLIISIKDSWRHLYDLFNLLEHLPHLQALELYLHAISEAILLPAMNLCKTGLQDLRISHSRKYTAEDSSLDPLFNLFPIYFPKLRGLEVKFIPWSTPLASFIKSAATLRSLRVSYFTGNLFSNSIESSSLQQLTLEDATIASFLALMENAKCPELSKLTFSGLDLGGETQPPNEIHYPGEIPPIYLTIETLENGLIHTRWETPKFRALRKLQLTGSRDHSGVFLVDMIMDPCICPTLTEIGLQFVPEWDLLFLMLERRNRLQGIARIQTLTLPSPIPLVLLEPLTDLLGGRVANRPSNWDLSFCGCMEEYFDPTM